MTRPALRAPLAALLFVLLYATIFVGYTAKQRNANYDLVPYSALATSGEFDTPEELHAATWSRLEGELAPGLYESLREDGDYRRRMANEADVFEENLGFYRARRAYPWLLSVADALGVRHVTAATWISVAAGACFVLILFGWLLAIGAGWRGLFAVAIWIPATGALDIARLWTPDTLAASTALAGFGVWMGFGRPALGVILLLASLAARSSNVVFLVFLVGALGLSAEDARERRVAWIGLALALGLYVVLGRDTNGWWPMFVHTCIERVPHPRSAPPSFELGTYLGAVAGGAPYFHLTRAGLWLATLGLLWIGGRLDRRGRLLVFALVTSTLVQFLAAPVLWDRLFVAQMGVSLLLWFPGGSATRRENFAS